MLVLALLLASLHPVQPAQDILLQLDKGLYNPSLIIHKGLGYLVGRSTTVKWDTTGLKWIVNKAYLCHVTVSAFTAARWEA